MAKERTVKVKAMIINKQLEEGAQISHFGHLCTVAKGGILVAEMSTELAALEMKAGRFHKISGVDTITA